jgi:SAM-dependent methyltransferase
VYEPYVGRWSRLVARDFVQWLGVPAAARWLDVGCGTGALTDAILDAAAPSGVIALDASAAYVRWARGHVDDASLARAAFGVADARLLPVRSALVDAATSGLVLNFVPRPEAAVGEMSRVTRAGGTVATYLWDYAGEMQLIRHFWDAAVELDAGAAALDEGRRFPLCRPGMLETLWRGAGLLEVESRAIDVPTRFRTFDDYWRPFLGGQGPAPGYAMGLGEERRAALRERIRARLPVSPDGSIDLIARAWAVRGVRAG